MGTDDGACLRRRQRRNQPADDIYLQIVIIDFLQKLGHLDDRVGIAVKEAVLDTTEVAHDGRRDQRPLSVIHRQLHLRVARQRGSNDESCPQAVTRALISRTVVTAWQRPCYARVRVG
jgi:hypothetical protein